MKSFSVIVAATRLGGIGKNGHLPWRLPKDMAYFKQVTTHSFQETKDDLRLNAVLMGRKTWDSIPEKFRPLPGRINLVLTRNPNELRSKVPSSVYVFATMHEALVWVNEADVRHLIVIGGSEVYKEALNHPNCEYIFLTRVNSNFDCDTMFPFDTPFFDFSKKESHAALEKVAGQTVPSGQIIDQGTEIQFELYRRKYSTPEHNVC
ncbi:hypothetical protein HMI54_012488 [Coelomomyces lativittatus]|nr:hypothetical protein HMI54_012488 [Coelomomyces lativittatus]KAJ1514972.1 hypothetical protein HMI56_006982 [Coelomomyces lativittatus]KAJ1517992.1 hypothetical protein HMI55_004150 [Coelomomyces lativittatus]